MTPCFPIHDGIPMPRQRQFENRKSPATQELHAVLRQLKPLQCADIYLSAFPNLANKTRLSQYVAGSASLILGAGNFRTQGNEGFVRVWRAQ